MEIAVTDEDILQCDVDKDILQDLQQGLYVNAVIKTNETDTSVQTKFTNRTQGYKLRLPPASGTIDRVTGHIATYVGIIKSRLGCHVRGEIRGVLGGPQLPRQTLCAHTCIHCGNCHSPGMPHIYPLAWHFR